MEKRKISNRLSYTLIAIGIFIILGVGVYAVAGVSHSLDEIPSIPWSKLTEIPSGFADGEDNESVCPSGYTLVETDYRSSCEKDFSEISCSVSAAIYVYEGSNIAYARRVDGVIQTRVKGAQSCYDGDSCDSGWVNGRIAECDLQSYGNVKAEFHNNELLGTFKLNLKTGDVQNPCDVYTYTSKNYIE